MIETRAREAARRAHLEVASIDVPDVEAVVDRRTMLKRARVVRRSAAVVVLIAVGSAAGLVAARRDDKSRVDVNTPTPTTPTTSLPARPGLSFESIHTTSCEPENLSYGLDGCQYVHDIGTSADVASASARDGGATGFVIDVRLKAASATKFANHAIFNAVIDVSSVIATNSGSGTLTLSGSTPWNVITANELLARILATSSPQ
jgi:hypothetical protein